MAVAKVLLGVVGATALVGVGLISLTIPGNRPDEDDVRKTFQRFHPAYELVEVRQEGSEVVAEHFLVRYRRAPSEPVVEAKWWYLYEGGEWYLHR
jgi:hypothetical protein